MFGRDRHRFAETERVGIIKAAVGTFGFRLVGNQHDRLAAATQQFAKGLVERRQAVFGIDHEQRQIGFLDRRFRLGTHAAFERIGAGLFETSRIDDRESQVDKLGIARPAVAGDARRIVDKRQLLANQTVEQRGLADIGAPYDGDGEVHDRSLGPEGRIVRAPCRMRRYCRA